MSRDFPCLQHTYANHTKSSRSSEGHSDRKKEEKKAPFTAADRNDLSFLTAARRNKNLQIKE